MSPITFPAPDLSERIDFCWSIPAGRVAGAGFHELLPDAGAHLVFRFSPAGASAVLLGPATEKASVVLDGRSAYFGVRFRPGQAPRLADVRARELTDAYVVLGKLAGRSVDAIADQLWSQDDLASRQRVVEQLLRQPAPPLVEDPRCRVAARLLEACNGQLRVDELAGELSLHVRSVERSFIAELGLTPKRLIRLVRLRYLLGALRDARFATLAELAQACGYADQAHMIKDFRGLTGRPPGQEGAFRARPLVRAETRIVHPRAA